ERGREGHGETPNRRHAHDDPPSALDCRARRAAVKRVPRPLQRPSRRGLMDAPSGVAGSAPTVRPRWTMSVDTTTARMTSEEIVALSRAHTFFSWSVQ